MKGIWKAKHSIPYSNFTSIIISFVKFVKFVINFIRALFLFLKKKNIYIYSRTNQEFTPRIFARWSNLRKKFLTNLFTIKKEIIREKNLDPAANNNHFSTTKLANPNDYLSRVERFLHERKGPWRFPPDSKSSSLPLAEWESRSPTRILITDLRGSTHPWEEAILGSRRQLRTRRRCHECASREVNPIRST